MKRLLLTCGWLVIVGGCDRGINEKFDKPSAKIVMMDEKALPADVQGQLNEIDQKLARIDGQFDQRLGAIERRLLNVEQGSAPGPPASGDVAGWEQPSEQLATEHSASGSPSAVGSTTLQEGALAVAISHAASEDVHEHVGPLLSHRAI